MATHLRKHKPLIGVTGSNESGALLWWATNKAVRLAGGRAERLTPNHHRDADVFDGFIISGGEDIDPGLYGHAPRNRNARFNLERDILEEKIITYALNHDVPILGICRGMQMMNVVLGGTLHQGAKDVLEDFLPNRRLISKAIGRRDVHITTTGQLFHLLGEYDHYRVNSIHHQAVDQPGQGLVVSAREENELIQATEAGSTMEHSFFIGVQWHPELMLHARSARGLFRALVKTAKVKNESFEQHINDI